MNTNENPLIVIVKKAMGFQTGSSSCCGSRAVELANPSSCCNASPSNMEEASDCCGVDEAASKDEKSA